MMFLPPIFTARNLLNQIVDAVQVKPKETSLQQPCDCEYMALLTEATNPYPLHLVNGGNYFEWVRKYGFYYSIGLGKKTAFLCLESKPITQLLSLVSLASGIPRGDLLTLSVCREHFGALNRALEQIYASNPLFCESPSLDLDGLIALIRHLKKHASVETVIVDALHKVRIDEGMPATSAEQTLISSILKSTAHIGEIAIIVGFHDPQVEFPNIQGDSVFHCGSGGDETAKAAPRKIAIAGLAMAIARQVGAVCRSLFRGITTTFH